MGVTERRERERVEIRQKILDGTFHRLFCPACGLTTMIDAMLV